MADEGTAPGRPSEAARDWSQRWAALLDEAGPSAARRIQRGQALARRGAVEQVQLAPGRVAATVAEDRSSPYRVELRWPVASAEAWGRATDDLRAELRFTASLLDGELPTELADRLADGDIELVPSYAALQPGCTCEERAPICRHVAAVHAAVGALVARDPGVLLQLAGRGRDELLRDLRRGADTPAAFVDGSVDLSHGLDEARGALEAIELRPEPVDDPAGLLRHLGDPPGVDDVEPFAQLIERAAATAWRLAAGDGAAAADEELLLAELRAQRVASAASLAEALGRDVVAVGQELDRLFEIGSVLRTGSGERARYRAASA